MLRVLEIDRHGEHLRFGVQHRGQPTQQAFGGEEAPARAHMKPQSRVDRGADALQARGRRLAERGIEQVGERVAQPQQGALGLVEPGVVDQPAPHPAAVGAAVQQRVQRGLGGGEVRPTHDTDRDVGVRARSHSGDDGHGEVHRGVEHRRHREVAIGRDAPTVLGSRMVPGQQPAEDSEGLRVAAEVPRADRLLVECRPGVNCRTDEQEILGRQRNRGRLAGEEVPELIAALGAVVPGDGVQGLGPGRANLVGMQQHGLDPRPRLTQLLHGLGQPVQRVVNLLAPAAHRDPAGVPGARVGEITQIEVTLGQVEH